MGKAFVYNTGKGKDDVKDDELNLEFGVFIDGTLNNKDNTDLRTKYHRTQKDKNGKEVLDWKKTNKAIEDQDDKDYDKLKNKDVNKTTDEKEKYLIASHRDFLGKLGSDNSFSNDYTNVARKWSCCKETYAIYVPGMGTSDVTNKTDKTQGINKDDDDGFQYGAGSHSGIRSRVRLGCEELAKKIFDKIKAKKKLKSIEITIDIFGFSRGAAAARNIVYEITKNEYAPSDIKVTYTVDQVVPEQHTFTETERLIIIPKHTIKVKKTKIVKEADSDGFRTDKGLYMHGMLPKMGHLGYKLLELGVKPNILKNIEINVRFLGIYDTVSSYEETGAKGMADILLKGAKHLSKSLFEDDIKQLNLNTLRCAQIVHFTAKDEHRQNFDLTRIPAANVKDNNGKYRRIEKNFPGVHCDIGGAYLTGKEEIDEIEVVNKIFGGNIYSKEIMQQLLLSHKFINPIDLYNKGMKFIGLQNLNPIDYTEESKQLLKDFAKKLVAQYWFKNSELSITEEWPYTTFKYYALASKREKVYKEYSYIPLHFMDEYCDEKYMSKNIIPGKILADYPIKDNNLGEAKKYLENYVMNKGGKEWKFIPDEVFVRKQKADRSKALRAEIEKAAKSKKSIILQEHHTVVQDKTRVVKPKFDPTEVPIWSADQKLLRTLRNQYFHWSANRDWLGMDQSDNGKRGEH